MMLNPKVYLSLWILITDVDSTFLSPGSVFLIELSNSLVSFIGNHTTVILPVSIFHSSPFSHVLDMADPSSYDHQP